MLDNVSKFLGMLVGFELNIIGFVLFFLILMIFLIWWMVNMWNVFRVNDLLDLYFFWVNIRRK